MPVVHSADVWKRTGRYDEVDETLVRFRDRHGRDMVLAMTHEDIVAELAASDIRSYRAANVIVYQIQTKFRDELRPRGGLLRTREFIMKDAYSLHTDATGLEGAYRDQAEAYGRIFRRLGLRNVHRIRSATGVMGGTVAHEFTCLLNTGEDTVVFCQECGDAWNAEVTDELTCGSCGGAGETRRGVEVGNIFQLGTRYSDSLRAHATGPDGKSRALVMGSYGIGISRLLATLIEQCHDDRGIALTAATAAFDAHLVVLHTHPRLEQMAEAIHSNCTAAGVELIWDDRGAAAGQQLNDADLIGATARVTTVARRWTEMRWRSANGEPVASRSWHPAMLPARHDLLSMISGLPTDGASWAPIEAPALPCRSARPRPRPHRIRATPGRRRSGPVPVNQRRSLPRVTR